ncbi:hypothetical protein AAUPMC_02172 [Pasteurella multocida subsp. multocida str. Anand1_cattle]|nr:hypothetical protein AAUPMC_02172 [Pasteurella multocida subsp. multocida str. Anand1_cattle]
MFRNEEAGQRHNPEFYDVGMVSSSFLICIV